MSNTLNSISKAQACGVSRPTKQDSIVDLFRNSEIEFSTSVEDVLPNIKTGFGKNNDLYYETPCRKTKLNTPLYKENYFTEFKTEEEKKAARNALGLYDKNDAILMSLLTTEDSLPTQSDLVNAEIKKLCSGNTFFTPATSFRAVYDSSGKTLEMRLAEVSSSISKQQNELAKITNVSKEKYVSSLGDVVQFLQGFNNGDVLYNTLDDMNQEMVRFEITGQITIE